MAREDLIRDLESAFGELEQSIEGLSSEQMLKPWFDGWTVRDILGHIIGWQFAMEDLLDRIARGERPVPEGIDYNDSDSWNARFADSWKAQSPQAAVTALLASKERFTAAALRVPEGRFEEGHTAHRAFVGNGARHYREHTPAIRAWRERENI
jgi:hypothetical protein